MKSYLIGYDLNKPGQNYTALIEQIKRIGLRWGCLDSTWIVKSNLSAAQLRDALIPYIDDNDKLLVVNLGREAAWSGFDEKCSSWLKNHL